MGDERQNNYADPRGQGMKRKVNANSFGSSFASPSTMAPTQHPPPPMSSPRDPFQTAGLPTPHKPTTLAHKVAIPRLTRPGAMSSSDRSIKTDPRHRVTHACEQCRHRKTKCSGERPTCKHCEDIKAICTYADGKRAMAKKVYHHMEAKVDVYQQLLLEISPQLDSATQAKIRRTIEKEPPSDDDDMMSTTSMGKSQTGRSWDGDGESRVSAGVGSTGSLDRINEDFNRDPKARATGFMGKASEVTWLHRLRDKIDNDSPSEQNFYGYATHHTQVPPPLQGDGIDRTYHCDDMEVVSPHQVEPFEVPTRQTAEFLLHCYLESVHPTFPMIGKLIFRDQVRNYFENSQLTPGKNWMAILNLVFAIGAVYSHVTQAEVRGDDRDHMIYFARARMLGMDNEAVLAQPDLQRVQIAGLMSFYLMSINQINRSWTLCGLAMRHSVTLGLHLRNEDPKLQEPSKEIRYRVWWAVYGLERALAVMTGRPASVVELDCVTPLPLPIDEEALSNPNNALQNEDIVRRMRRRSSQESPHTVSSSSSVPSPRARQSPGGSSSPNSNQSSFDLFKITPPCQALYFTQTTLLSAITHDIMCSLYRSSAKLKSWHQIQTTIANLDTKLERWRSGLSSVFDFTRRLRDPQFTRERMILGFLYYSAKMIIHRPCLCRLDQRISNESNRSKDFNRTAAARCVMAARDMLNLIPDEPNPPGLYAVAPWWCLTHHLTQAATVLIMELFYRSEHMPHEINEVIFAAKKAVRWLNGMASEGVAARRAWIQCNDLLHKITPMIGTTMDGMPTDAPTPPMEIHYKNLMHVQDLPQVQFPQFYGRPAAETDLIFHPTMYNPFDETVPFEMLHTTSNPAMSSLFPTASQMEQYAGAQRMDAPTDYYGTQGWDQMDGSN